jgi:hypothetical protein
MSHIILLFGLATAIIAQSGTASALLVSSSYVETSVENYIFQKDIFTFSFKSGKIRLHKNKDGHFQYASFSGDGQLSFTPSSDSEKKQLKRFYKTTYALIPISSTHFIFCDSTAETLLSNLSFGPPVNANSKQFIQPKTRLSETRADIDFYTPFIDPSINEKVFYAYIPSSKTNDFEIIINDALYEEVEFYRYITNIPKWREIIIKQHKVEKYKLNQTHFNPKYLVDFSHLTMTVDVRDDDFDFLSDGTFRGKALRPFQWLYLNLYGKMDIDSIMLKTGESQSYKKIEFLWDKNDNLNYNDDYLFVNFGEVMQPGTKFELRIVYHGDIIKKRLSYFFIETVSRWIPRHNFKDEIKFNISYRYPKQYDLVSSEIKLAEAEFDDYKEATWTTTRFEQNMHFYFGKYKLTESGITSKANITVYADPLSTNVKDNVIVDLENSVNFFTTLLGPSQYTNFYVVEIPYLHGLAYPGMIQLSYDTFTEGYYEEYDEQFRAHEVAHQWWGIGVDDKTYHDKWISEGFSEYFGLMYVQLIQKDNDAFFKMMNRKRRSLLETRNFLFSENGQEASPITMGYRVSTSTTAGDYSRIIYSKGAWVLHMLRNLALDLKTHNEDIFKATMRDFYQTYQGKQATTEDFKATVEKHYGINMDWFFNQWVYGSEIPKYTYSYKTEKENGNYFVTMKIRAEGVSDDHLMYIPIRVDFGDEKYVNLRISVSGKESIVELPALPLEPDEIKFNIYSSVLCDFDDENWKD